MTSLYTILDAVGFLEGIVAIVVDYDGDPFGDWRWEDELESMTERHAREIQEHEERKESIKLAKWKRDLDLSKKRAMSRLKKNAPVNDFRTAMARYEDACIVYPENTEEYKTALAVMKQFERERNTMIMVLLDMNFGGKWTNSHDKEPKAWVECNVLNPLKTDHDTLHGSLKDKGKERCVYRSMRMDIGIFRITSLELPDDINLSDLLEFLTIIITNCGRCIRIPIKQLSKVADLRAVPIRANGINWEIEMNDLFRAIDENKFKHN